MHWEKNVKSPTPDKMIAFARFAMKIFADKRYLDPCCYYNRKEWFAARNILVNLAKMSCTWFTLPRTNQWPKCRAFTEQHMRGIKFV